MEKTCKECGCSFELTEGEIDFYRQKGLELPKRCPDCRKKNKNGKKGGKKYNKKNTGRNNGNDRLREDTPVKSAPKQTPGAAANQSGKKGGKGKAVIGGILVLLIAFIGWFFVNGQDSSGDAGNAESAYTETADPGSSDAYEESADSGAAAGTEYHFANSDTLNSHYEKHGIEMGYPDAESYEKAASAVINNPAALHKIEAEDGDDVYYLEKENYFVVVSPYGKIRTFFCPNDGKAYYDRQ